MNKLLQKGIFDFLNNYSFNSKVDHKLKDMFEY